MIKMSTLLKTSTEIDSIAQRIGEERAIELVARAGFDAWDFSMFKMATFDWKTNSILDTGHPLTGPGYAAFARRLRQVGEDCGIHCNQSHAPFPVRISAIRDLLKRAIECTAIAGGDICVIHPDNNKTAEENAEMYLELLPFAKEHGVRMATENMWNWNNEENHAAPAACSHHDDFLAHIRAVNDPYLVACVDIGHAEMKGLDTSAPVMLRTLGEHVQALHLHDNDCWHDSHQRLFTEQIDFDAVVKALKEIGYKGYLTLESCSYLPGLQDVAELSVGVERMAEDAKRLAEMYAEA